MPHDFTPEHRTTLPGEATGHRIEIDMNRSKRSVRMHQSRRYARCSVRRKLPKKGERASTTHRSLRFPRTSGRRPDWSPSFRWGRIGQSPPSRPEPAGILPVTRHPIPRRYRGAANPVILRSMVVPWTRKARGRLVRLPQPTCPHWGRVRSRARIHRHRARRTRSPYDARARDGYRSRRPRSAAPRIPVRSALWSALAVCPQRGKTNAAWLTRCFAPYRRSFPRPLEPGFTKTGRITRDEVGDHRTPDRK